MTTHAEASEGPTLSLIEAVEATGASLSTLRRRVRDGAFPNAVRGEGGAYRLPVADLVAAGFTIPTGESPTTPEPVAEEVRASKVVDLVAAEEVAVLRERLARAEAKAEAVEDLRVEVTRLRTRDERRSAEVEELREAKGRAEATAEARSVEVDRLLHVVDRLSRAVGGVPDEEARVVVHEAVTAATVSDEDTSPDPVDDPEPEPGEVPGQDEGPDTVVDTGTDPAPVVEEGTTTGLGRLRRWWAGRR